MLTILIPTYANRNFFFARLINYIINCDFKYDIYIADSSESDSLEANFRLFEDIAPKLNIKYNIYDKRLDWLEKVSIAIDDIQTPYILINADDDFITPSGIERSLTFLEANPDYSLASGYSANFELTYKSNNQGIIKNISCQTSKQLTVEHRQSYKRLLEHLSAYEPTFYAVHRTKQLRYNFKKYLDSNIKDFRFMELLPSCMSLIQGKKKIIDCLYLLRQVDLPKKYYQFNNTPYLMHDWIADPNWSNDYNIFRLNLAELLVNYDKMIIDDALKIIKIAMWKYMISQNNQFSYDKRFSLQELAKASSPYYTDFFPVFKTLSNEIMP